jgi:acetylornithine deacetylase/succinyl-diaminopimelate desuccinylase-like protein
LSRALVALAGLLALAPQSAWSQPAASGSGSAASAQGANRHRKLLREIYRELIEIDTTQRGSTTRAARAMAARLRAAGFPARDVRVLVHPGNKDRGNLVARMRGTGAKKPVLLLAHLDVVEARREDWSDGLDPFKLTERDGYFYGRGTTDDKAMAAIFVANLIRFRAEGYRPERDIILALTADEEGGDFNGVDWLVQNHRALIDAELGINEGGGGRLRDGKHVFNAVQASEKVYQSFALEVRNRGGHSSLPVRDNAIYRLSSALGRLSRHDFPVNLNEVTRAFFQRMATLERGQSAADMKAVTRRSPDRAAVKRLSSVPLYNSTMRTTCVATQVQAGHAENALPQSARAVVNCRILPHERVEDVERALARVVADPSVRITRVAPPKPSPPSPLTPLIMRPIEQITEAMWPGAPVIPVMGAGATDSLYLRRAGIPTYGVSGLFGDMEDVRAHGKDERLGVAALWDGQEFLYRLTRAVAGGAE